MREAEKLVGEKPIAFPRLGPQPKRLLFVSPTLPRSGPKINGVWSGELLIDKSGKVAHFWKIRDTFERRAPAIITAITDAVQKWEYEPFLVEGKAVYGCNESVSVNVSYMK